MRRDPRSPQPGGPQSAIFVASAFAIVLAASPYVLVLWDKGIRGYFGETLALPADIGLVALLVVASPMALSSIRARRLGPGAWGWLAVAAALALAFPWNPSGRGVLTVFHLLGAAALAGAVAGLMRSRSRRSLAAVICAVGGLESALSVAQVAFGRVIGLSHPKVSQLVEVSFNLFRFGSRLAPYGTFPHPYVLAAFSAVVSMVAATMALDRNEPRPAAWALAGAIGAVPLGLTFSRTALLGLVLAGLCLVWGVVRALDRRRLGAVIAMLAIGAGVPAASSLGGWQQRAALTVSTTDRTEGRTTKAKQALTLLSDNPLTGVGPGRYVFALERRYRLTVAQQSDDQAVHNLPLLAGAEGGVLALLAMTAALVWLGWRALRSGPLALAVYTSFLPFCLLDQLAYESVQGVVICAVWLGLVDALVMNVSSSCREAPASGH